MQCGGPPPTPWTAPRSRPGVPPCSPPRGRTGGRCSARRSTGARRRARVGRDRGDRSRPTPPAGRESEMVTLRTPVCDMLGIEYPIVQAPMAGTTTVDLVAAVCEAGALGSFGHAYTEPAGMLDDGRAVRARTTRPFGMSLFVAATPDEPPIAEQREAI